MTQTVTVEANQAEAAAVDINRIAGAANQIVDLHQAQDRTETDWNEHVEVHWAVDVVEVPSATASTDADGSASKTNPA